MPFTHQRRQLSPSIPLLSFLSIPGCQPRALDVNFADLSACDLANNDVDQSAAAAAAAAYARIGMSDIVTGDDAYLRHKCVIAASAYADSSNADVAALDF